jgi:hypothetical protein
MLFCLLKHVYFLLLNYCILVFKYILFKVLVVYVALFTSVKMLIKFCGVGNYV